MAAEVGHRRSGQNGQQCGIGAGHRADHAELTARCRQGAKVVLVNLRRTRQLGASCYPITEEQPSLRSGGYGVVGAVSGPFNRCQGLGCKCTCGGGVTGDQAQRGSVDGGKVAPSALPDPLVHRSRRGGQFQSFTTHCGQGTILLDTSAEGGHVFGVDLERRQTQFAEPSLGFVGGAGTSQCEHRSIGKLDVPGVLFKSSRRYVIGR